MWLFENGILFEDYIGKRWHAETGEVVDEIIFPSRHSASSGKPSLTLHPIGVPHLELDEVPPFGGKSGEAPPPSTRIAEWWRLLQSMAAETELDQSFELTLEVSTMAPISRFHHYSLRLAQQTKHGRMSGLPNYSLISLPKDLA